jgi:hypothetical protein
MEKPYPDFETEAERDAHYRTIRTRWTTATREGSPTKPISELDPRDQHFRENAWYDIGFLLSERQRLATADAQDKRKLLDQAKATQLQLDQYQTDLAHQQALVDELDRRAGELTRKNDALQEQVGRHTYWLDQRKAEAGFHRNTSFDNVWDTMLAVYRKYKDN